MANEIKYYDYIQSQYVVCNAERLCGKEYNNLTIMINFDQDDIDPEVMLDAINQSIERFPSCKLRVHDFTKSELEKMEGHEVRVSYVINQTTSKGKEPVIPRQYFVDECDTKCERISFKNERNMYKFIKKFARKHFPNNYQDTDLFAVYLVERPDGRYGVLLKFYHIIADTYAIIKFVEDFANIYKSVKTGSPMPAPLLPLEDAWEYCERYNNSPRAVEDQKYWDDFFSKAAPAQASTINGFENKKSYIPGKHYTNNINIFNTKATQVNYKISADLTRRIREFAENLNVSPKVIYLLSLNTWLSKKSGDYDKFVYLDLLANRNKKIFAKTSGDFASNLPFYVDVTNDMTFNNACLHVTKNYLKHIKHSRLNNADPMRAFHKQMDDFDANSFKMPWVRGMSSFIFTYQPYFVMGDENDLNISVERFPSGKSPMPIYAMFMPTDNYTGEMNLNFEYSTIMHKKKDFDEFYEFMIKFLEEAITHPEKSIADLKNV